MIRLLITDVDGTLVKEGQSKINPEYFEVIRALHKKGVRVVAASGRAYSSIHALLKPVEDIIWFVADGGTRIKTTGELESVGEIPRDMLKEAWSDIRKIDKGDAVFCGVDWVYSPYEDSEVYRILHDRYKMKIKAIGGWDNLPDEPCCKFTVFRECSVEKYANIEFCPKWKDKLHLVCAGDWWIDCMMPGVNKGSALQSIMDKFGYKKEEVMATGDNMNDIDMLEVAGTALAVSSARDEVKQMADRVIENFETDGVLKEWKKVLNQDI